MSAQSILEVVEQWFREVGSASLKLPSGWFGRPYDNLHRLTAAHALADRLILVLDNQMVLTLAHPTNVAVDGGRLSVSGFTHASWDWDEYGFPRPHLETFQGGEIEFLTLGPEV
jgi:hypothetical protein